MEVDMAMVLDERSRWRIYVRQVEHPVLLLGYLIESL